MDYQLSIVKSRRDAQEFLHLPIGLYRDDPHWIRPLDKDVEEVFDPSTNKRFRQGEAIRWLLRDAQGNTVGRVAAFIDRPVAMSNPQPTGGMGFFECINCRTAAFTLFDACRQWLAERGMEAMDGPINFGDRNRFWGLLVEGNHPPNYCMDYHLPYYRELFEAYGFRVYFHQYTYHRLVNSENVNPVVWEKAKRIAENPAYSVTIISKKEIPKFADHFQLIYNQAWVRYTGIKPITKAHALALFSSLKPILDERLIHFAYFNGQPIGFLVMIPELNQVVKHLNGQFHLLAKLKLMYLLKVKKACTKALGVIYGTVPEHQGKGLEGALINNLAKYALAKGFPYKDLEMNWIGDFNPGMRRIAEQVGTQIRKVHITYRFMFDPTKEVVPPKRVS